MSSNFSSTALKDFDIPKALFMRKGGGKGEKTLVHFIQVFSYTRKQ